MRSISTYFADGCFLNFSGLVGLPQRQMRFESATLGRARSSPIARCQPCPPAASTGDETGPQFRSVKKAAVGLRLGFSALLDRPRGECAVLLVRLRLKLRSNFLIPPAWFVCSGGSVGLLVRTCPSRRAGDAGSRVGENPVHTFFF